MSQAPCMCSNANEIQGALFVTLSFSLTTRQSDISLRGWGKFFSDFQIFHTHFVYEMFLCLFVNETRRYFVDRGGILSESFLTKKNVPHPLNEISPSLVVNERNRLSKSARCVSLALLHIHEYRLYICSCF